MCVCFSHYFSSRNSHVEITAKLLIKQQCLCNLQHYSVLTLPFSDVPTGSPSRGGDATLYVFDINQQCLPTPFYSVLVSVSVFMALSTVFHSINSPDNSRLSHSVLPVLFVPSWSFSQFISLSKSLSALIYNPLWLTGLKAPTN